MAMQRKSTAIAGSSPGSKRLETAEQLPVRSAGSVLDQLTDAGAVGDLEALPAPSSTGSSDMSMVIQSLQKMLEIQNESLTRTKALVEQQRLALEADLHGAPGGVGQQLPQTQEDAARSEETDEMKKSVPAYVEKVKPWCSRRSSPQLVRHVETEAPLLGQVRDPPGEAQQSDGGAQGEPHPIECQEVHLAVDVGVLHGTSGGDCGADCDQHRGGRNLRRGEAQALLGVLEVRHVAQPRGRTEESCEPQRAVQPRVLHPDMRESCRRRLQVCVAGHPSTKWMSPESSSSPCERRYAKRP